MKRLLDFDKFKTHLVSDGELLKKAQLLRGKVFFGNANKDEDEFDKFCKHVVIVDKQTHDVVGTYRLLLGSAANDNVGFYSETEFDLSNIRKNCKGELLEMGRACVDINYRKYPIINIIWSRIISYIEENNVKYVFGCSSVDDPTPDKVGKILKFFKEKFFSPPALRVHPLEKKNYPYTEDVDDIVPSSQIIRLLPALVRGYLKMGAFVCGEPVWDREFNTADFFMILDVGRMNASFKGKFYGKDA